MLLLLLRAGQNILARPDPLGLVGKPGGPDHDKMTCGREGQEWPSLSLWMFQMVIIYFLDSLPRVATEPFIAFRTVSLEKKQVR